jgi:hypothetical protein
VQVVTALVVLIPLVPVPHGPAWAGVLPLCWLWWRYAGVSGRRSGDGLRVRGVWRTRHVPWSDVLDVAATDFSGGGFSHTVVVVGPGEPRHVVVGRSFRMGSAGYDAILSWLPSRHPLRPAVPAGRPANPRDTVPEVDPAEWAGLPVLSRPPGDGRLRTLQLALCGAVALAAVVGLAYWAPRAGLAPTLADGLVLVGTAWLALRVHRAGTELTPAGVLDRGVFGTHAYPVAAIGEFVVVPLGPGGATLAVLYGHGTRLITAGTGFGAHPAATAARLNRWLAGDAEQPDGNALAERPDRDDSRRPAGDGPAERPAGDDLSAG